MALEPLEPRVLLSVSNLEADAFEELVEAQVIDFSNDELDLFNSQSSEDSWQEDQESPFELSNSTHRAAALQGDFDPLSIFEAFAARSDSAVGGDSEEGSVPHAQGESEPPGSQLGARPDDPLPLRDSEEGGSEETGEILDPEELFDAFPDASENGSHDHSGNLPGLEEPASGFPGAGQGARPDDPLPLRDGGGSVQPGAEPEAASDALPTPLQDVTPAEAQGDVPSHPQDGLPSLQEIAQSRNRLANLNQRGFHDPLPPGLMDGWRPDFPDFIPPGQLDLATPVPDSGSLSNTAGDSPKPADSAFGPGQVINAFQGPAAPDASSGLPQPMDTLPDAQEEAANRWRPPNSETLRFLQSLRGPDDGDPLWERAVWMKYRDRW